MLSHNTQESGDLGFTVSASYFIPLKYEAGFQYVHK